MEIGIETHVVEHKIMKKQGIGFYISLLNNLFSKYPYVVDKHYSKKMIEKIKEIARQSKADLVHCENTPYAINILDTYGLPSVIMAHNIEAIIWERRYKCAESLLARFYMKKQWEKMQWFEMNHLTRFDELIFVSEEDKEYYLKYGNNTRCNVVDNGVDLEFFRKNEKVQEEKNTLVFVGSLDWYPNIDGIRFFIKEIIPILDSKLKEFKFYVVGRNPDKKFTKELECFDTIEVAASVEDVREYIDKAGVYVVPLRIGGGSRLKILEALSMEKAVISTSVGAEGLNVENNKNICICDSPMEFADKIVELLNDMAERKCLGTRGRELVEKEYSWQNLAKKMDVIWEKAITNKGLK
jgi:glycosyltransferase involved in cell wall biosynthesis